MGISYAVTVCNEFEEIQKLLPFLIENIKKEDEIVVLYDSAHGDEEVENYLRSMAIKVEWLKLHVEEFKGDFAEWKNRLTKLCTKDYIFQLDADEMISEYLIRILPQILNMNDVDVIGVPRINTVEGITEEHIREWRWNLDEQNRVNFPDYQYRIYKNNGEVRWHRKVHETLTGHKTTSHLPVDKEYCLIHSKTIERQEKQNKFYSTI